MATRVFVHNAIGTTGTAEAGAKLYGYVRNTTTPQTFYTDSGLTVPASNPYTADAAGHIKVYYSDSLNWTFTVKSADLASTLLTVDILAGVASITYADLGNFDAFNEAAAEFISDLESAGIDTSWLAPLGTAYITPQPLDATLTALAGLTVANGHFIKATGADTFVAQALQAADIPALTISKTTGLQTALDGKLAITAGAPVYADFTAARAATGLAVGQNVLIRTRTTAGDGGGGVFWVTSDTTSADDGGLVLVTADGRRLQREFSGVPTPHFWGAHPSASAAVNTAAIDAAIRYLSETMQKAGSVKLHIPGQYFLAKLTTGETDRAITLRKGVTLEGIGTGAGEAADVRAVVLTPSEAMSVFIGSKDFKHAAVTITSGTPGVVNWTGHGFAANTVVSFRGAGLPSPLVEYEFYYVRNPGANTFEVSATSGGASIAVGSGWSGRCQRAELVHSAQLKDIEIWGGSAGVAVPMLVAVSTVESEWVNVRVNASTTGTTKALYFAENPTATWINRLTNVTVGSVTAGVGLDFEGSDSDITDCLLSGCAVNCVVLNGSVTIQGGQIENANNGTGIGSGVGLRITAGRFRDHSVVQVRTKFISNKRAIEFADQATASNARALIDSGFHDSYEMDVYVGTNVQNVSIDGSFNELHSGATAHIEFSGTNNTGCVIAGQYDNAPGTTRIVNPPADAMIIAHGEDGGLIRAQSIIAATAASTPPAVPRVSLDVMGGRTAFGVSDALAGFQNGNANGFDATLVVRGENGNAISFDMRDGPQGTTAAQMLFRFRGAEAVRFDSGAVTSKVVHQFDAGAKFGSTSHIEMGSLNAAGEIRMRTAFAVAASGGSGLKELDHSGANADGLGIYGHDGVSIWAAQTKTIEATFGVVSVSAVLRPSTDNVRALGEGSFRWTQVFAANGTINTSDAREKTPIRALSEAERRVGRALAGRIGVFQWLASVAKKGGAARLHIGLIAQDVEAAFAAEGLDPWAYGLLCADDIYEDIETVTPRDIMREVPVTETRIVQDIEWINGAPVLTEREVPEPVIEEKQVTDADGNPVFRQVEDKDGNLVSVPLMATRQKVRLEPDTVEDRKRETVRKLDENGEPLRRLGLRYEQLILFMMASAA